MPDTVLSYKGLVTKTLPFLPPNRIGARGVPDMADRARSTGIPP